MAVSQALHPRHPATRVLVVLDTLEPEARVRALIAAARELESPRRCAEVGNGFCMMFHGNDLMKGERVERDLEAGLAWLRRAGETGNWWAVSDLGHLYDEGWYAIPRDPDEAARWKRRLAELGDPEARGWLLYHGYR